MLHWTSSQQGLSYDELCAQGSIRIDEHFILEEQRIGPFHDKFCNTALNISTDTILGFSSPYLQHCDTSTGLPKCTTQVPGKKHGKWDAISIFGVQKHD